MTDLTRHATPFATTSAKTLSEAAPTKFMVSANEAAPKVTAVPQFTPVHSRKMAGKQAQITFALPPELLDKVDHMANSLSISRAAFIKQALTRAVNSETN